MAPAQLGQNFLAGEGWRERIFSLLDVRPNDVWIEIGAGHGEMTENLVAGGSPVYAIEVDPPLVAGLQRMAKQFANLTVVPGDILELDLAALAAGRRLRVYGNLPYYITSPILQRLFSWANLIDVALPMPCPPPVMMDILPCSRSEPLPLPCPFPFKPMLSLSTPNAWPESCVLLPAPRCCAAADSTSFDCDAQYGNRMKTVVGRRLLRFR